MASSIIAAAIPPYKVPNGLVISWRMVYSNDNFPTATERILGCSQFIKGDGEVRMVLPMCCSKNVAASFIMLRMCSWQLKHFPVNRGTMHTFRRFARCGFRIGFLVKL